MTHCCVLYYMLIVGITISGSEALKFADKMYEVSIVEVIADDATFNPPSIPPSKPNVIVRCVNDDGSSVNGTITYTIVYGNLTIYSIDSITGNFSVSSEHGFNYEQQTWHNVSIRCEMSTGQEGELSVGEGIVNVSVISLNEYKPTFTAFVVPVPETTAVGTIIATTTNDNVEGALKTYEASDRDDGPGGCIDFYFEPNIHSDLFGFDTKNGRITLVKEFDVDTTQQVLITVSITITACNDDIDISSCENRPVTIYLTAANDLMPVFMEETNSVSVNESASNGTSVIEVVCMDLDVPDYSDATDTHVVQDISFTNDVSDEIRSLFEVVYNKSTSSATVYTKTELDYENTTQYMFSLNCSDGLHFDIIELTINVLPVNDNPPKFEMTNYDFSVNRASPVPSDTLVGTVIASDADTAEGKTISYSLDDDSSKFNINSETGEITLRDYIGAGDGNVFDFDVVASDGENEARAEVRVTVTGLLSVLEWIYVGIAAGVLLVILVIIGIIVFHHFIKAASIRTIIKEQYKEREPSEIGSEQTDYPPQPLFLPPPHLLFPPHDGGMSMVGQPLDPTMEDDYETSEHSGTMVTMGSQYPGPGPVLQEVVDYFREGDKIIDKKGNKK